jgi:hypothetical protein
MKPNPLPRRDYVLLPLISVLTLLVLFGIAEGASRLLFKEHKQDACAVPDTRLGMRYKPNCTSVTKAAEGPWVTNHYNDCGSRSPGPCGAKPAGSIRIVVTGSSMAQAYLVPYDRSFAARASAALTRSCHRDIEFQDLASIGYIWNRQYDHLDDVLALSPDAVVQIVVPFDLEQTPPDPNAPKGRPPGLMKRIDSTIEDSRAVFAAQHLMFRNLGRYVSLYLRYGDKADFLRPPFGPIWQKRLADYDALLGRMADKLKAHHVPFVLVYVPQRAQAALLQDHTDPPGVDPAAFSKAIGKIAGKYGITYIDASPQIAASKDLDALYYAVDGHLSSAGNKVLAKAIEKGLVANLPMLGSCGEEMTERGGKP